MKAELDNMRRWLKVCLIVLAVLMIRVWENVQAERLGRSVSALRLEADKLTYENGRLQLQIHQYTSPTRLEAAAKERKMIPLDAAQRVGVRP